MDYNEVALCRRVFRDGRSEYRINGTICRLKDIQDLLAGTGIGRAAYSVMEQGKIDLLISAKPEDRRMVFEEAAGITKFKSQKKEALRKLEYTEANLLRVADIIAEVKRQMGIAPAPGREGEALPGRAQGPARAGHPSGAQALHRVRRGEVRDGEPAHRADDPAQ